MSKLASFPERPAQIWNLGPVLYGAGLRMQQGLSRRVASNEWPDQILVLEHNPVFTLGRNATRADIHVNDGFLDGRGVEVHETDRGGQVTYHGPGQVVAYPLCNLQARKDLKRFVWGLEEAMILTAADFGVTAVRLDGFPGVWVNTPRGWEKLGALGIHLKHWISTHGIAFNVRPELHHFQWITPCGITDKGVCSLYSLLGDAAPTWDQAAGRLSLHMATCLCLNSQPNQPISRSISALTYRKGEKGLEILMMLRQPDQGLWWSSVTGMIEAGESPLEAAKRELKEETGLEGRFGDFNFEHSFWLDPEIIELSKGEPHFNREHCFYVEVDAHSEVQLNREEHSDYRWCGFDEAMDLMGWDGGKVMLKRLVREVVR